MNIKFLGSLQETFKDFSFNCTNLSGVFSAIKFTYGEEFSDSIFNGKYGYVVCKEGQPPLTLRPEVLTCDLSDFDDIYIVPTIVGDEPVTIITAVVAVIFVVASLVMLMGLNQNREITGDPAIKSNLFSGSPLIREEGGIVPLVYGNPYCGGVLISSGLYTTQRNYPGLIFGGK